MMIPGLPTLGVRFDVDRINAGSYGEACWEIFWQAVDPKLLSGAALFEGDTGASLSGHENVFCIAVQTSNAGALGAVRSALANASRFNEVCSPPRFLEGSECSQEPLINAGRITRTGELMGDAWNARPALLAARPSGWTQDVQAVNRQFFEWTYDVVQELERISASLPIQDRAGAHAFFESAAAATGNSADPVERQSGSVFASLMGVVSAADRKDYTVSYHTDDTRPGYGVFTLETFDDAIGVLFVVFRVGERDFLSCVFTNREKEALRRLLAGERVQPPVKNPRRKGWWATLLGRR